LSDFVAPGVIRAALYHDVSGLEFHVLVVEQQGQLAFEDRGVIDRFGAVHDGMPFAPAVGGGILVPIALKISRAASGERVRISSGSSAHSAIRTTVPRGCG